MRTKYISKTHNSKGQKHPGIYGKQKEICPQPQKVTVNKFSLPKEFACALQEMYPEMSLTQAVKEYLLKTVIPTKLME